MKRDKWGLTQIFPKENRLILDIYPALIGIPKDHRIKRATMGIDLNDPGAWDRDDAAKRVMCWRELNDRPELVTVDQIQKAFRLINAVFQDKDNDSRFGWHVNQGEGGINATGRKRFYIKHNDESINKDDFRIITFTTSDNLHKLMIVTRLRFTYEHSKNMWETETDPILKLRWSIKMHQEGIALAEAELAMMNSYV